MMFEHLHAQDIVDVAPDRRTAKGRFRCLLMGGVHETKKDAPPRIPGQFWEGGLYENEYVREDGVWKIQISWLRDPHARAAPVAAAVHRAVPLSESRHGQVGEVTVTPRC
jgi:hypothetical protein